MFVGAQVHCTQRSCTSHRRSSVASLLFHTHHLTANLWESWGTTPSPRRTSERGQAARSCAQTNQKCHSSRACSIQVGVNRHDLWFSTYQRRTNARRGNKILRVDTAMPTTTGGRAHSLIIHFDSYMTSKQSCREINIKTSDVVRYAARGLLDKSLCALRCNAKKIYLHVVDTKLMCPICAVKY